MIIPTSADLSQNSLLVEGGGDVKILPISHDGNVTSEPVDIEELSTENNTVADVVIENSGIKKRVEIQPGSKFIISSEGNEIKQTNIVNGSPQVELYYNYQKDYSIPWTDYARVDSCTNGICRIVYANFSEKRVWLGFVPIANITSIVNTDDIPARSELM